MLGGLVSNFKFCVAHLAVEYSGACLYREELLRYGELLEDKQPELCKFNLHLLACRIHIQAGQRGDVYSDTEMWVERMMQRCKKRVRYRNPKDPEKVMAMHICEEFAVQKILAENPRFRDFDSLVPAYRDGGTDLLAECFDNERPRDSYLLHRGERCDGDPFAADLLGVCWRHTVCFLREQEILKGTSHTRARTRDSSFVKLVVLRDIDEVQACDGQRRRVTSAVRVSAVARIKYFIRVVLHGGMARRYAVCTVFDDLVTLSDNDIGEMLRVRESGSTDMRVPLEDVECKLLVASPPDSPFLYCLQYFFLSHVQ